MYLIFDTETSTFPDSKLSARHPAQARVVQLAAIKLDEQFNEVEVLSTLIKPDGWRISSGAQSVHGISMERCEVEGREVKEVFQEFTAMALSSKYMIAHNHKFDSHMLTIESSANSGIFKTSQPCNHIVGICTMELCTPICKLPQKRKGAFGQQYKWPKLQEAYQYFFGEPFDKAHDALADVRATARIFKHLVDTGLYKTKEVMEIGRQ